MEFNNKLYDLRKKKGFSQEELANRLNVSRQTVSKWEVGDSTPDMEKLIAMSDLFGISLDKLVMDKSPEPVSTVQPSNPSIYSEKGLKIAALIFGAFLLIDIISFVIYVALNGFPK